MLAGMFAPRVAAAPPSGFWTAIAATSPEVWLKLNEASGATAANSGSGSDATIAGTVAYEQGALSTQAGANSIATSASATGYVDAPTTSGPLIGVIGLCYAGTGAFNSGAAILWRTSGSGTGGAYLRIDATNIVVQIQSSITIDTGVASSGVKDGNPHLIIVGKTSEEDADTALWIDGEQVWSFDAGANSIVLESTLYLTRNGGRAQYCYGKYADVFVARNVSAAQVAAINSAWAAP